ncbi:MAG: phage head morphogenesis protein [Clostridia bacterium]|nr:phage head morphogenesis protein [Clostridia bacterium]
MYYKNIYGHVVCNDLCEKGRLDAFSPPLIPRNKYYYWIAIIDERTCPKCYDHHEKIFSRYEEPEKYEHEHLFCRCIRVSVDGIKAGLATKDSANGADWWLKNQKGLPDYYISKEELKALGWNPGERPSQYAPGKMLTMGIYKNSDGRLPETENRVWYEADINYTPGRRNQHRVVWSNDGLIFVTYDHYRTFYEVF